ncbi:hypothetical protein [Gallaecimonas sp. GXIMD4217]|uniref:hypothetical protein n=1 Tax=Gallaecimonas sp. GXIMD4217 TaxID=3131927 RepID=UPI00311B16BE
MAKLDKEEVLSAFSAAYQAQHGKAPQIDQKGSWYSVDGGKSLRLADIAAMTEELQGGAPKAEPAKAEKPKAAAPKKAPAKKAKSSNGGLLPRDFWEDLLEGKDHHCRRPRGF